MIPHKMMAVAVGEEPPIVAVLHHEEGDERDSGFSVLFSDAPYEWRDTDADIALLRTVCLHCLIEHHPEVGRGLDLARKSGEADRDPATGEWIADAS